MLRIPYNVFAFIHVPLNPFADWGKKCPRRSIWLMPTKTSIPLHIPSKLHNSVNPPFLPSVSQLGVAHCRKLVFAWRPCSIHGTVAKSGCYPYRPGHSCSVVPTACPSPCSRPGTSLPPNPFPSGQRLRRASGSGADTRYASDGTRLPFDNTRTWLSCSVIYCSVQSKNSGLTGRTARLTVFL